MRTEQEMMNLILDFAKTDERILAALQHHAIPCYDKINL